MPFCADRTHPPATARTTGVAAVALAACAWAAGLWAAPVAARPGAPRWAQVAGAVAYVAGGALCHQRPERAFRVGGRPLPVCARCTGLYAAAPAGLVLALACRPRRREAATRTRPAARATRAWLVAACLPTAASVALEAAGLAAPGPAWRAVSAVPLGMLVAWLAGAVALGDLA